MLHSSPAILSDQIPPGKNSYVFLTPSQDMSTVHEAAVPLE